MANQDDGPLKFWSKMMNKFSQKKVLLLVSIQNNSFLLIKSDFLQFHVRNFHYIFGKGHLVKMRQKYYKFFLKFVTISYQKESFDLQPS